MSCCGMSCGDSCCREPLTCYERFCGCFARRDISPTKCVSVVPWWPLLAITLFGGASAPLLLGLLKIVDSIGVVVAPLVTHISWGVVAAAVLLDLLFAYSVCSNKLRIHNIHCNAEGCRGYRIKDAEDCGSRMLRCGCKLYNLIILTANWTAMLITLVLCAVLSWFAGCTLSVVAACTLSQRAVDLALEQLVNVTGTGSTGTPISNFAYVAPGTTATIVCANTDELTLGSLMILGSAPVMLLAQVIMLVSYNVVAETSWRHLKDMRKADEAGLVVKESAVELRRQQIANSQRLASAYGGGGGGGGSVGGGSFSGGSNRNSFSGGGSGSFEGVGGAFSGGAGAGADLYGQQGGGYGGDVGGGYGGGGIGGGYASGGGGIGGGYASGGGYGGGGYGDGVYASDPGLPSPPPGLGQTRFGHSLSTSNVI